MRNWEIKNNLGRCVGIVETENEVNPKVDPLIAYATKVNVPIERLKDAGYSVNEKLGSLVKK